MGTANSGACTSDKKVGLGKVKKVRMTIYGMFEERQITKCDVC